MKKMQNFHKRISSKDGNLTARESSLIALTRLDRGQVELFAASDPWLIWSFGSNAAA